MSMNDEEYYRIKARVDSGVSLYQACSGDEGKRTAYRRMKARKERESSYQEVRRHTATIEPLPAQAQGTQEEQEQFSDEDYAQVVPNWKNLPAITKELWKKNLAIARKPGASPQNANIHAKTMVALCPEFREKKERTVFTPDDYKKIWLEVTESIRRGDKIETYEEHYGKNKNDKS